ncbi:MAG: hypothetical protein AAF907_09670, partial [Planctomycetota bacterium]
MSIRQPTIIRPDVRREAIRPARNPADPPDPLQCVARFLARIAVMLGPFRPAFVAVALLSAATLLSPDAASGQDLGDLFKKYNSIDDLKEQFKDLEKDVEQERDRLREQRRQAERQRLNPPDVRPAVPGRSAPAGLYGVGAPRSTGAARGTFPGAPAAGAGPYGPTSPLGPVGPVEPAVPTPTPQPERPAAPPILPPPSAAPMTPASGADAAFYVMRNPALAASRYRIDGLPGGAIVVERTDDAATGPATDFAAMRESAAAAFEARRTLRDLENRLRDVRVVAARPGSGFP